MHEDSLSTNLSSSILAINIRDNNHNDSYMLNAGCPSLSLVISAQFAIEMSLRPKSPKKIHKNPILAFNVIQDYWIWHQSLIHPCNRRTDRRTELRWLRRAIAVPAVACKNCNHHPKFLTKPHDYRNGSTSSQLFFSNNLFVLSYLG